MMAAASTSPNRQTSGLLGANFAITVTGAANRNTRGQGELRSRTNENTVPANQTLST